MRLSILLTIHLLLNWRIATSSRLKHLMRICKTFWRGALAWTESKSSISLAKVRKTLTIIASRSSKVCLPRPRIKVCCANLTTHLRKMRRASCAIGCRLRKQRSKICLKRTKKEWTPKWTSLSASTSLQESPRWKKQRDLKMIWTARPQSPWKT